MVRLSRWVARDVVTANTLSATSLYDMIHLSHILSHFDAIVHNGPHITWNFRLKQYYNGLNFEGNDFLFSVNSN